jgi:hypothetical protein
MACTAIIEVATGSILAKYTPFPPMFPYPTPDPTPGEGQVAVIIPDTLCWQAVNKATPNDDGTWTFTEDPDQLQVYWNGLRQIRNNLLAESDWTQLTDVTADKESWATYRKALRDLPGTTTNPASPVWPEKPT